MQDNVGDIITDRPGESAASVVDDSIIGDTIRIDDVEGEIDSDGNNTAKSAPINSDIGDATFRRKRDGSIDGRSLRRLNRQSTGDATEKKSVPLVRLDLTKVILNLHNMGAAFLKSDLIKIEPSEAAELSEAIKEVNKYYGVNFDPKKVAMFNLITTAGTIYGTRIMAAIAVNEIKKASDPQPKQQPKTTPINQPRQQPQQKRDISEMTPSELFGAEADASL